MEAIPPFFCAQPTICYRMVRRLAGLAMLFAVAGCVHTPEITDAQGRVVPGSIATMESTTIGGIRQSIWFRGVNDADPPLILLHGGPGASESALFRHFNAELEQHFLMAYWEQRGAGRSFHSDIPPESMTIEQFLSDLNEVVDLVRRRFHKERVVLLGHSWGTILGTMYAHRHPHKVAAYVGVAQIADNQVGARLSHEFALGKALERGDKRAIEELQTIGPTLDSVDERLALGRWVERFGGMFNGGLTTGRLIWAASRADEVNLLDLIKFGQGNRFSLERLERENAQVDLTQRYLDFQVPIFFLLGRRDWHVPAVLAATYFDAINAPCKRLVWFEQSAHNPPFEEPQKFNEVMVNVVRPVSMDAALCTSPQ